MRVWGWVGVGLRGAGGEMQEDGREVGELLLVLVESRLQHLAVVVHALGLGGVGGLWGAGGGGVDVAGGEDVGGHGCGDEGEGVDVGVWLCIGVLEMELDCAGGSE